MGVVSGCAFKNNYVISDDKSKPSYGGATGIRKGTVMENCYFEGNYADKGGAIYFFSQGTVNNCKFIDNAATYGGAIYAGVSSSNIQDCIFNGNSADYGGVIYATKCQLTIFNSNFDKCVGGNGGAVYSLNSELSIFNSNFTGNVADNGGAIHTNGEVNVFNSNFLNNSAVCGGAIFSNCDEFKINNTIFKNNYALNGSAIYNNGKLNIYESFFEDNKANSYSITSSKNAPIKKGEDLIITVKLLVGDNLVDAIYNQGNITIDDNEPKQSSLAINQEIVLILDNNTYIVKTNNEGVAEFIIDSSDLDIGNFTYFFMYIDSELYSGINDNDTVEILENPTQKNVNSKNKNEDLLGSLDDNKLSKSLKSKTKKYANLKDYIKSKGYTSFRDLIVDNSHKYSPSIDRDYNKLKWKYKDDKGIDDYLYNMWKINWPHKYSFQEYMKNGVYAPFLTMGLLALPLFISSYYSNGKIFEANIKNNGDFWKIFDEPLIHFYGYKSHFKDEKGGKVLLDFLVGIDENGDLSIGNMLVNLLSVISGIGIASGATSRITGNTIARFFRNNNYVTTIAKYTDFIKNIIFDSFSIISSPFNVFNVILGRIGKEFVDGYSKLFNSIYSFFYNDVRNIFYFLNPKNQQNAKTNIGNLTLKKIDSSKLKDIISRSTTKLNSSFINIKNKLQKLVKNVKSKVSKLVKNVNSVIKNIKNKINNIVKNVRFAVKTVKKKVNKFVKKVKNTIKKVTKKVDKLVKNVKSTVKKIQTKANNVVKNIKSSLNNIRSKTGVTLKNQVNKLVKKVKTTVKKIQSKTKNLVKKVKKSVRQIKIKAKNVVHTVKSSVQHFKNKFTKGISRAYTGGKRLVNRIYSSGKRILSNGYNQSKKFLTGAFSKGKRLVTNLCNGLKKLIFR